MSIPGIIHRSRSGTYATFPFRQDHISQTQGVSAQCQAQSAPTTVSNTRTLKPRALYILPSNEEGSLIGAPIEGIVQDHRRGEGSKVLKVKRRQEYEERAPTEAQTKDGTEAVITPHSTRQGRILGFKAKATHSRRAILSQRALSARPIVKNLQHLRLTTARVANSSGVTEA